MSHNALVKHLDDKHEFRREWKQHTDSEEENTSARACDGSHTNQCPAAGTWQMQRKGRSTSAVT